MGKDSRSADKICFPQDTKKSGRRYARGESKCDVVVDLTLADPAVTFVEIATGVVPGGIVACWEDFQAHPFQRKTCRIRRHIARKFRD